MPSHVTPHRSQWLTVASYSAPPRPPPNIVGRMPLEPGLAASFDYTVTDNDTALAYGSGDVPVLATPKVLALAERATFRAVFAQLTDDLTSVGVRAELDHLLPVAIGTTVRVDAVLEAVDGRRLTFRVWVSDAERTLAEGAIVRLIVTRARFLRVVGG
jgi:fluoroacetyl-CoA thioesterase